MSIDEKIQELEKKSSELQNKYNLANKELQNLNVWRRKHLGLNNNDRLVLIEHLKTHLKVSKDQLNGKDRITIFQEFDEAIKKQLSTLLNNKSKICEKCKSELEYYPGRKSFGREGFYYCPNCREKYEGLNEREKTEVRLIKLYNKIEKLVEPKSVRIPCPKCNGECKFNIDDSGKEFIRCTKCGKCFYEEDLVKETIDKKEAKKIE